MKIFLNGAIGAVLLIAGFYAATLELSNLHLFAALTGIIGGSILCSCAIAAWIAPNDLP